MPSFDERLDRMVEFLTYGVGVLVITGLLVTDPTSLPGLLPTTVGLGLAVHAAWSDRLDEFGYALIGFVVLVALLAVVAGVISVVGVDASGDGRSDALVPFVLAVSLLVAYAVALRWRPRVSLPTP
ncbi:hypothetical protein [Halostella sp. PRR32]|uniref:hypothetical protein n=1 Tax=Halostella sp. PRR32 TaxID=3098147 RepID=UPI002B1D650F|nr:hypothetical protein [Halostella sp. PRR32]